MQPHRIPYAATRRFTPLVLDYLAKREELSELYRFTPDLRGLREAAAQRTFPPADRAALCTAIAAQYAGTPMQSAVAESLAALRQHDALTVVAGHQLCLFGGPLYVPFKILNAVRLARTLTKELGRPVVPVFWMASEDHDRDEIDHTWFSGTKVHWPGKSGGAVGPMPLTDIGAVLAQAEELLGPGAHAAELRDLLYACYRPERTLLEATRQLMDALYGRFGVLLVDGDDPVLKRLFVRAMQQELLHEVGQRSVLYANEQLDGRYKLQAFAREINLFHLRPGHRSRIVQEDGQYRVLDGGPVWSAEEILAEVEARPEQFSPNVLMRPLYQETILPNIAYVGGGGELAYWLQLRWFFQGMSTAMPALFLRNSAAILSTKAVQRWKELGLDIEELFAPIDGLKATVAARNADFDTTLDQERRAMEAFYAELMNKAAAADATLRATVEARFKSAMKGLERVEKGLVRSAKRKDSAAMQRIDAVHAELFPAGGLQERRENILPLLAARGFGFLDELLELLDPLDPRFTLLEDQ